MWYSSLYFSIRFCLFCRLCMSSLVEVIQFTITKAVTAQKFFFFFPFFFLSSEGKGKLHPKSKLGNFFSISKICYWCLKLLCEYCKSFEFEMFSNVSQSTKSVTSRLCLHTIIWIHQFFNRRHIFDRHFENFCDKLASCIGVLSKIRTFLSLQQRLLFYNAIIRPVISYADVIWSSCDKEPLYRVLKLQKRVAKIILYAVRVTPSVTLFYKLGWIPFYEQSKIVLFFVWA